MKKQRQHKALIKGEIKPDVRDQQTNSGPGPDHDRLVHELEIHQIELELQNEELKNNIEIQHVLTQKYSDLFEFAPTGYIIVDIHGRILDMNDAAIRITGCSKNNLDRNFSSLLNKENRAIFNDFIKKIFEEKKTHDCEVNLAVKDQIINLRIEGRKQNTGDTCMLAIIDITQKKETEKELTDLNKSLRESVFIKDKLLSIIGHDLRGPLTSILMFFNLFSDELKVYQKEKLEKYMNEIIHDTEQALLLLENLIALAKLKTGIASLKTERIDLKQVVNEVIDSLSDKLAKKNIQISNNIPSTAIIHADDNMIRIILSNLIINSIKFTNHQGNIEVHMMKLNKFLDIIVTDNGIGMTPGTLLNLNVPGNAHHSFGTDNEPGSGLGLSLCREIISLQGGELWIESRKNQGTSVHFTVGM